MKDLKQLTIFVTSKPGIFWFWTISNFRFCIKILNSVISYLLCYKMCKNIPYQNSQSSFPAPCEWIKIQYIIETPNKKWWNFEFLSHRYPLRVISKHISIGSIGEWKNVISCLHVCDLHFLAVSSFSFLFLQSTYRFVNIWKKNLRKKMIVKWEMWVNDRLMALVTHRHTTRPMLCDIIEHFRSLSHVTRKERKKSQSRHCVCALIIMTGKKLKIEMRSHWTV